tara:strand:+ start:117 stop:623 length:507 start_codon:yes stop_codon:yes gene_type:complete
MKAIKHFEWASEETFCYQANVYLDGKPVAVVSNDGHGGCDRDYDHPKFKGDYRAVMKSIEEYFKSLPPSPLSYEGTDGVMIHDSLPQSFESWCHEEVREYLIKQDIRKAMKRKHIVKMKADGRKGYYLYEFAFKASVANINKHYPNSVILNGLPFEEAVKEWKECENA